MEESAGDRPIDDELDGRRIRQLLALRHSAIRARSYAVIGAVLCGFAAIGLVMVTVSWGRAWGLSILPVTSAAGVVVALFGCAHFFRRIERLRREINEPVPLPPTPPGGPDFSTLSDGSQRWRNLEDIR